MADIVEKLRGPNPVSWLPEAIHEIERLRAENKTLVVENDAIAASARAVTAHYERLRAAQQWQPIESAPKDGTRVLLWLPGIQAVRTGSYCADKWGQHRAPRPYWEWAPRVNDCRKHQPTHWMPYPLPPARAALAEGGDA